MNDKHLFTLIGEVSDDLIQEAAQPQTIHFKRRKTLKVALVAAALVVAVSSAALASSGILGRRSGHSWSSPTYTDIPAAEKLQKDVGFSPRILERFTNGYAYQDATISHETDEDTAGNVMEKYKALNLRYVRGDHKLTLSIDPAKAGIGMADLAPVEHYRDVAVKYHSYTNKFVPGDYELTEQDEADKASGKYVFSFGTEEIEIHEVQITAWEHDGLNYVFCAMDSDLTQEELLQMAKEVIDCQ